MFDVSTHWTKPTECRTGPPRVVILLHHSCSVAYVQHASLASCCTGAHTVPFLYSFLYSSDIPSSYPRGKEQAAKTSIRPPSLPPMSISISLTSPALPVGHCASLAPSTRRGKSRRKAATNWYKVPISTVLLAYQWLVLSILLSG